MRRQCHVVERLGTAALFAWWVLAIGGLLS